MWCMRKTTDKNVDDEEASSREDDKDSSRLENLHWCTHRVRDRLQIVANFLTTFRRLQTIFAFQGV